MIKALKEWVNRIECSHRYGKPFHIMGNSDTPSFWVARCKCGDSIRFEHGVNF